MAADMNAIGFEFKAEDVGDTTKVFAQRLDYLATNAGLRTTATVAQQTAEVRYFLYSAQIRELLRQVESFTRVGKITIVQGLQVRLPGLRAERDSALKASGLPFQTVSGLPVPIGLDVGSVF